MSQLGDNHSHQLADDKPRQLAINPHGSYAVSAPAGSGKTELLIQRTLSLLSKVEQPEAILGITFTRKAANEMRERVSKALSMAHNDVAIASEHEQLTRNLALAVLERDRELNWGLLTNPNRLRFQTIDGLCRQLANQLCLETGIVIPPDMTEDPKALCLSAAERLIDYLEDPGSVGEQLRILVTHLDGNLGKLVELIRDLLSSRDSWLPIIVPGHIDEYYLQDRVDALVEEALMQAAESLMPYFGELEELLDFACQYREGANWLSPDLGNQVPEAQASHLRSWKALCSFLMTGGGEFRGSVDKRLGFPTEAENLSKANAKARKEQMKTLLADLAEDSELKARLQRISILPEMDRDKSGPINQALFRILPVAAAEFDLLCQERGETDYTAVAMAALDALGTPDQPTPLALRLDYRIEHILVDEFQDTSSMQVELLRRLTAGWQDGDGRSLFIVGDGMQSIYGFRKANVSLFIRARREGIDHVQLQPIDLTSNFRSDQQIVDWVNTSFSRIFPEQDNLVQGQVAFREAQATRKPSDWGVQLNGYASELQEAEHLAVDILEKLKSGETSLAILVRGRTHLREILPALRAHGIQWQAQNIDRLSGRMAVTDIHCLTRALCCPADRIAWLSILRAPWAGFSLADLLALIQWPQSQADELSKYCPSIWSNLKNHESNPGLSAEAQLSCRRLVGTFESAFENLGVLDLRSVVEKLWFDLGGDQGLLESRDKEDVSDYLDLLEYMESGGVIVDWMSFEHKLGELYSQPDGADGADGTDATDSAVQIMTIHSAKGLEFDHVYLPGLHRQPGGSNEAPLLLWWQREFENGEEAYLLSAKPAVSSERVPDLYSYLKAEENQRQRQETARLLYVATTRARKSLFVSGKLNWDEEKEKVREPDSRTMLSILWGLYENEFMQSFTPDPAPARADEEENSILAGIRRLPPARPLPQLAEPLETINRNTLTESDGVSPQSYLDNYQARLCGDLIHHSLMRIVREQIEQPSAEMFRNDWNKKLENQGLTADQKRTIHKRLETMLNAVLEDPKGQWLLDWKHEQSAAELEMDYLNSFGGLQRAVIDRTFICDGTRWIVDYKSSAPATNEQMENFLRDQVVAYRPQLTRYASLFDEPVKAMLYFPAIPIAVDVNLVSDL